MYFGILSSIAALALIASSVNGQVPLADLFPFGEANGDTNLRKVVKNGLDDGYSPEITLPHPFEFFNSSLTSLIVNINGCVSFKRYIYEGKPYCEPLTPDMSMIAPFWADVDLRTTPSPGTIFYRLTTEIKDLDRALVDIKGAFPNLENQAKMEWALIATWYKVGFIKQDFSYTNKTNTFQVALVNGGQYSFVIFNYNDINWTTGFSTTGGGNKDGLGGSPARAGYDNGFGSYYNLPGSCQANIINISKLRLNNIPGKFVFRVDGDPIVLPGTSTMKSTTVTETPTRIALSSLSTSPPNPSLIPSSTSVPDKMKERKVQLEQKLKTLKAYVKKLCRIVSNRIALESRCSIDLDELGKLLVELPLVKHEDELKSVEAFYIRIADDISNIEEDISL